MGWDQLISITKEARDMRREDAARARVDCPICGEILDQGARWLNCPLGHYRTRVGATHARP